MKKRQLHFGQTLIEFALIIPLVLLLMMGFFDLGRAVFYYSSISNSVREGTRYAIVHNEVINGAAESGGFAALTQIVRDNSFGIDGDDLDIDIERVDREHISITARYLFVPVTPGISRIFGSTAGIELRAQSTMRISGGSR